MNYQTDAETTYKLLLLEAIQLSDTCAERLEDLYQKYPSDALRQTIECLQQVQHRLSSTEKCGDQNCATRGADVPEFPLNKPRF